MNNDQINELLALMGQQIKENAELRQEQAELRETSDRRFTQLTEVMVNGFLRLEDRLGARIDRVSERLDVTIERLDVTIERLDVTIERLDVTIERLDVTIERLDDLTSEVREVKTDLRETNRRFAATFDHVGQLTEQTDANQLRLSHVEEAQQPTNAELDARLRAVEAQLRNAS